MKKLTPILAGLLTIAIVAGIIAYGVVHDVAVLNPQGVISSHQRDLFILAGALGLSALIPIFVIAYLVIHRYSIDNPAAVRRYSLNWQLKPVASLVWGAFVTVIITSLAVVMFKSTHAFEPYKPLTAETQPLSVQVVALPWKWLFIYPEQQIATVNELVIPANTPIAFTLTGDAPMSSFWIPKLGGMIYVMEGMVTQLHLAASSTGEFPGVNTEINGKGYAGMKFTTKSVNKDVFDRWVADTQATATNMDWQQYQQLAKDSTNNPVARYTVAEPKLFDIVVDQFSYSNPAPDNSMFSRDSHIHHAE